MATVTTDVPTTPVSVNNLNVATLANLYRSFIRELATCQSSQVPQFRRHDRDRVAAYVARAEKHLAFFERDDSGGQLDLPRSHPLGHAVEALEPLPDMTNADVREVVGYFTAARREILFSQSADTSSGLMRDDLRRQRDVLATVTAYMATVVGEGDSLDFPEQASAGGARVGE